MTSPTLPEVEVATMWGDLPAATQALFTSPGADYIDTLTLRLAEPSVRSARWWAESMFEGHADPASRFLIFRALLALSPLRRNHIVGWQVAEEAPQYIRLLREGRRVAGEMIVATDGTQVHLGLAMTYRNALGRAVWERLAPVHRGQGVRLLETVRDEA